MRRSRLWVMDKPTAPLSLLPLASHRKTDRPTDRLTSHLTGGLAARCDNFATARDQLGGGNCANSKPIGRLVSRVYGLNLVAQVEQQLDSSFVLIARQSSFSNDTPTSRYRGHRRRRQTNRLVGSTIVGVILEAAQGDKMRRASSGANKSANSNYGLRCPLR